MKHLFLTGLLALAIACNSSKTMTGEVNYSGTSEPGTILLTAAGYGATRIAATGNAETNAFNNLIFHGIPGSQQRLPMVSDEKTARREHAAYFQQLLDHQGYKAFLMVSDPQSGFDLTPTGKNLLVKIKINVDALRRDMEQQGVLRKFGI